MSEALRCRSVLISWVVFALPAAASVLCTERDWKGKKSWGKQLFPFGIKATHKFISQLWVSAAIQMPLFLDSVFVGLTENVSSGGYMVTFLQYYPLQHIAEHPSMDFLHVQLLPLVLWALPREMYLEVMGSKHMRVMKWSERLYSTLKGFQWREFESTTSLGLWGNSPRTEALLFFHAMSSDHCQLLWKQITLKERTGQDLCLYYMFNFFFQMRWSKTGRKSAGSIIGKSCTHGKEHWDKPLDWCRSTKLLGSPTPGLISSPMGNVLDQNVASCLQTRVNSRMCGGFLWFCLRLFLNKCFKAQGRGEKICGTSANNRGITKSAVAERMLCPGLGFT